MGARGPAPKSTNLRILEGNPSRRPLNNDEPQPEQGAVCPDWLSQAARVEWDRLAPILEGCNILTKADTNTLAAYCDSLANYIRTTEEIAKTELIETTSRGKRVTPLVSAQRNYAELMVKFGTKLGLSPSDRSSIKTSNPAQKSIWSDLIQ